MLSIGREKEDRWTAPSQTCPPWNIPAASSSSDGTRPAPRTAVIYAITGRSPSSQARKLDPRDGRRLGPADRRRDPEDRAMSTSSSIPPSCSRRAASPSRTASRPRTSGDRLDEASAPGPVEILAQGLAGLGLRAGRPDLHAADQRLCPGRADGRAVASSKGGRAGKPSGAITRSPSRPGKGRLVSTYDGLNSGPAEVVSAASPDRRRAGRAGRRRPGRIRLRGPGPCPAAEGLPRRRRLPSRRRTSPGTNTRPRSSTGTKGLETMDAKERTSQDPVPDQGHARTSRNP